MSGYAMAAQHENLPPKGYVQACSVITHGDRIADGVETVALNVESSPAIVRALNLIREDNGGPSWPPEDAPLVAKRWQPHLAEIERAIHNLSDNAPAPEDEEACERIIAGAEFCYLDSELYNFCNGESTVIEAIAATSPSLMMACKFLNDFFEGWSLYDDGDFDPRAVPA